MRPKSLFYLSLPVAAVVTPVYAVDYLSIEQAQQVLFANGETLTAVPVHLSSAQLSQIRDLAGVRQRNADPKVWKAQKDGETVGWFLVDEVVGKHEFITYATALSADGKVLGVEIMSYRETHGGEIREAKWRALFKGKTLADQFRLNRDIPNISGATLSCRNITDGVKRLLALQKVALTP
jgi:Na+-translocating ferredoxin:NAD+ oxidoreductase RnfG subunit